MRAGPVRLDSDRYPTQSLPARGGKRGRLRAERLGAALVVAAAAVVAACDGGDASGVAQQCTLEPVQLTLDFGTGEPDPTITGPMLEDGVDYLVTVSGTYSIWTSEWQNGACKGTPGAGTGGTTGIDPEYFFAIPTGSALCGTSYTCCPNHTSKLKMSVDGGADFDHTHSEPEDYSTSHTYQYRVRGQGQPLEIMLEESSARDDDYGVLNVTVACDNG